MMAPVRGLTLRQAGLSFFLSAASSLLAATGESEWLTRVWQSDDGLPNNNVTSLAQTSDGYLWVANPSHLTRFDGVQFDEFSTRSVIEGRNEHISALLQTRDDGLWVALDHGPVAFLRGGVVKTFTQ